MSARILVAVAASSSINIVSNLSAPLEGRGQTSPTTRTRLLYNRLPIPASAPSTQRHAIVNANRPTPAHHPSIPRQPFLTLMKTPNSPKTICSSISQTSLLAPYSHPRKTVNKSPNSRRLCPGSSGLHSRSANVAYML